MAFEFVQFLFSRLNIPYTKKWTKLQIELTPYIQSMFGLSSLLSRYNIGTECIQLANRWEIFDRNTPCFQNTPCIVVYNGQFAVLEHQTESAVIISTSKTRNRFISLEDFVAKWNGIILNLNADSNSREPDYEIHRHEENKAKFKQYIAIVCLTAIICWGIVLNQLHLTWYWWALLTVNIIGICVSFLLLQKQLHIPNRLTDKLCGLVHESHCETVTQSNGANVFGLVKLSEIGTSFFCINTISILFFPPSLPFIAFVAAAVLPFSFWSLWYQKSVAKSWCVLCLITLGLMWLQAGIYLMAGIYNTFNFQWYTALILTPCYGIVVLLINNLMSILEQSYIGIHWHHDYNFLKVQNEVINAFLSKAPQFDTSPQQCSSLIFGNPDAQYNITVFSNPYCDPCAIMHQRIKDMPGHNVCINYVMTYFTEELSIINRYLIAAYQQLGAKQTWSLLSKWYDGGKKQGINFFKQLDLNPDTDAVFSEMRKHDIWRQNDKLRGTPTVIVNGREIIMPYTVEDYLYFSKQ